jgi:hypothetical protein
VDFNPSEALKELKMCLLPEFLKKIIIVEKATGKETKLLKYENSKQMEYALTTLHKTIQNGINLKDLVQLLFKLFEIFSEKSAKIWKTQLDESNFMKLLAVLFEIVERLNQNNADKDLSVVYSLLQYNELNPNTVASATNK